MLKPTNWIYPNSSIVRIIDGDSIVGEMSVDIGFHGKTVFQQKLRLNRINAPAVNTRAGQDARMALANMLSMDPTVKFETIKPYKYGDEWMVEITLDDGENVSDAMVQGGHAVYWDGTGPRPSDG